jgi:hypothetical protein
MFYSSTLHGFLTKYRLWDVTDIKEMNRRLTAIRPRTEKYPKEQLMGQYSYFKLYFNTFT